MSSKADPKFTACSTLTSSASASMLSATTSGQAVSARLCCSTWTTCLPCFRTCKAKDVHRLRALPASNGCSLFTWLTALFQSTVPLTFGTQFSLGSPAGIRERSAALGRSPAFAFAALSRPLKQLSPGVLLGRGISLQSERREIRLTSTGMLPAALPRALAASCLMVVLRWCAFSAKTRRVFRTFLFSIGGSFISCNRATQPRESGHSLSPGTAHKQASDKGAFAQRSLDGDPCFSSLPTARGSPSSNLFQKSPREPPCPPTASPQQRKPRPSAAGLLMGSAATGRRSQSAPGRRAGHGPGHCTKSTRGNARSSGKAAGCHRGLPLLQHRRCSALHRAPRARRKGPRQPFPWAQPPRGRRDAALGLSPRQEAHALGISAGALQQHRHFLPPERRQPALLSAFAQH